VTAVSSSLSGFRLRPPAVAIPQDSLKPRVFVLVNATVPTELTVTHSTTQIPAVKVTERARTPQARRSRLRTLSWDRKRSQIAIRTPNPSSSP
jgi:hypothetical protein